MSNKRSSSVWDAIEAAPARAESMKLRSSLMLALRRHMEQQGLSQTEAARVFGVTELRVADLINGRIGLFGLDALIGMLAAAGMPVTLSIRKAA